MRASDSFSSKEKKGERAQLMSVNCRTPSLFMFYPCRLRFIQVANFQTRKMFLFFRLLVREFSGRNNSGNELYVIII